MSKLEELIEQYCPDGVEYMKIGEVCKALPKGTLTTKELVEPNGHNYPVINSGRELYGYYTHFNNEGDAFTVAARGEYAGFITYFSGKFWAGGLCYPYRSYSPNISTKFIFYYLKTRQEYIRNTLVAEGSIPALNKGTLDLFEIPVTPLPVQEEIVRILDAFTELQAELQKRKQQYNYYLDNLLNFKNINRGGYQAEVRWMKLKDVCMKTSNIKWKSTTGQYRYIDLSSVDIQTHSIISTIEIDKMSAPSRAQQIVQEDDVIFATTRPTQMRACIIPTQYNGDICSTGYCVLRVDTKILLPRFLFFSLTVSGFKTYLSNNLTLGNYPSISNNTLLEYEVPVPSLANQQRIVSILDRFDTLTTDLTQGLPAEIEKRRQQYEYYRDKLLTFKRKGA